MKVDYVVRSDNPEQNAQLLREGVEGIPLLYGGPISNDNTFSPRIWAMFPKRSRPTTMEVYANGSLNIFIRDVDGVIGLVRVRQE